MGVERGEGARSQGGTGEWNEGWPGDERLQAGHFYGAMPGGLAPGGGPKLPIPGRADKNTGVIALVVLAVVFLLGVAYFFLVYLPNAGEPVEEETVALALSLAPL